MVGTLATTTRPSILPEPKFFEPLSGAPHFHQHDGTATATLRMIIRGLCAVVIRDDAIDIVLMDARKHKVMAHVGKFTVEDQFAVPSSSTNPAETGMVEIEHPQYAPIRAWDINGSIVTFTTDPPPPESSRIQIVEEPAVNPWSSMGWQLDFERVYPEGRLRTREDMERTAAGAIAGIIRLTHGRLESALPGRRYGNTGVWEMARAGDVPSGQREIWRQALSDTLLYSLDVPVGQQVTLNRRPLEGYDPGPNAGPSFTPIVLKAPEKAGDPLPCGLSHEPPLGQARHSDDLPHNRMFYELLENPPESQHQTVPKLVQHWVDRGVGREARSAYWAVTRDQKSSKLTVNVCDPNCNGAVYGLKRWRERQQAAAKKA